MIHTIGEPPCIAGACYPNDDGTACAYCGLPAEPVDPQEIAEALYAALQDATERDRAQQARVGGRAILAYYAMVTVGTGSWPITLTYEEGTSVAAAARQYDRGEASRARRHRAYRDAGLNFARPHWPIMLVATHERAHANDPRRNGCCDALDADLDGAR